MSLTVNSYAKYSFGSEYFLQKLINSMYSTKSAQKSSSSILLDVYRQLYFSQRLSYDDLIETYMDKKFASNDDAVVVENNLQTLNTDDAAQENYVPDEVTPENSTVSYHV